MLSTLSCCCLVLGATMLVVEGKHVGRNEEKKIVYETYEYEPQTEENFFWPNPATCCKVGEKLARKSLSCDTHEYLEEDTYFSVYDHKALAKRLTGTRDTHVPKHVELLIRDTQICIFSRYTQNFKKCCHYQEDYRRELALCREYKRGGERRRCRNTVHQLYP